MIRVFEFELPFQVQGDPQVFLAGSAALRACLDAMKGSSQEQAGSLASEVVTALTKVCVSALYTRSITVDSSVANHASVHHPVTTHVPKSKQSFGGHTDSLLILHPSRTLVLCAVLLVQISVLCVFLSHPLDQ